MVPGVAGSRVRERVRAVELPQPLNAIIDNVPVVKLDGTDIEMELPELVTRVQFAGKVQL